MAKVEKLDLENLRLFSEIFFFTLIFHFLAVSDDFSSTKKKFFFAWKKLKSWTWKIFNFFPRFFFYFIFHFVAVSDDFSPTKKKSWT